MNKLVMLAELLTLIDDWCLTDDFVLSPPVGWGPFQLNVSLVFTMPTVYKFFSRYWTPGTSGVEVFAQNWSGITPY